VRLILGLRLHPNRRKCCGFDNRAGLRYSDKVCHGLGHGGRLYRSHFVGDCSGHRLFHSLRVIDDLGADPDFGVSGG